MPFSLPLACSPRNNEEMDSSSVFGKTLFINMFLLLSCISLCNGALVKEEPLVLRYHNGPVLSGNLSLSVLWYGKFTPSQRSILVDFLQSLNPQKTVPPKPSVSTWWKTIQKYPALLKKKPSEKSPKLFLHLNKQTLDPSCSMGNFLKRTQIAELAAKSGAGSSIALVFTADDVTVEGFCMNSCGRHGSAAAPGLAYVWVGNSAKQCPGQCAWPFHQPLYGPQVPPLVSPNGDVGADGMVINLASVLAATVTNPFNTGFFQGPPAAPLEAASACPGIYGQGAYPGYAGVLLVDPTTGGSYNANGLNGRKFLLPAVWDPQTSTCFTLV